MRSPRSLLLIAALLCACSPALDWRQMNPAELGVQVQFPCRPASLARDVPLLQGRSSMVMYACSAAGSTYALSKLTLSDVRDVTAAIDALFAAAARNLRTVSDAAKPFEVPGMTPNPRAGRLALTGQRPDGSAVTEHLLVFVRGARVYQASVVGDAPDQAAVSTFFGGLKVTP
ncbi:MAG TPA: hypothetical protein VI032_01900 [Burkholderiaceae bacterium]